MPSHQDTQDSAPGKMLISLGVLAIVLENNKVGLEQTAYRGGRWSLPGGFLEAGESPINALRREILEELGVSLKIKRFAGVCHRIYDNNLSLVFETCVSPGETPRPDGCEVLEFRFFSPTELPDPISSPTRAIIEAVLRFKRVPFVVTFHTPETGEWQGEAGPSHTPNY